MGLRSFSTEGLPVCSALVRTERDPASSTFFTTRTPVNNFNTAFFFGVPVTW
jgi:hypothetical protein